MLSKAPRIAVVARTHDKPRKSAALSRAASLGAHFFLLVFSALLSLFARDVVHTLVASLAPLSFVFALLFSLAARAEQSDVQRLEDKITATGATKIYLNGATIVGTNSIPDGAEFDNLVFVYTNAAITGALTLDDSVRANARILLVGGGGAGGNVRGSKIDSGAGGGGGAGGYLEIPSATLVGGNYSITVGAGGAAAEATSTTKGGNGGSSFIATNGVTLVTNSTTFEAFGGGGGGSESDGEGYDANNSVRLASGGGGSQQYTTIVTTHVGGKGMPSQGNNGGDGTFGRSGGGGGGAGTAGGNSRASNSGGIGGKGLPSDITGGTLYYAGGGGGGTRNRLETAPELGFGGMGGGGNGGGGADAKAGVDGFGGGGGGGSMNKINGAKGGCGTVIVRITQLVETNVAVPTIADKTYNKENQVALDLGIKYTYSSGTLNATNADTYVLYLTPGPDLEWVGGGREPQRVEWTILPRKIAKPLPATDLDYDGTDKIGVTYGDDLLDYCTFSATSVTNATNGRTYHYSVSLDSPGNAVWADGTTDPVDGSWTISAITVVKPTAVENLVYSGTNSIVFAEYEGVKYLSGYTNSVNAGAFNYWVRLDNPEGYTNYVWAGESGLKSVENVKIDWSVASQQVDVPEARSGLIYTGEPQDGFESLNWSLYKLVDSTTTNETAGGTYEATFHLTGNGEADNYVWKVVPETTADQTVEWTIAAATNEITSLKMTGWRIGVGTPTEPEIEAKFGKETATYEYGFGSSEDEVSESEWITDKNAITNAGTWIVRATIDATENWTKAVKTATFGMWTDPRKAFRNHVDVTINPGNTTTLTNFPALVKISESLIRGFTYVDAGSTGNDIAFMPVDATEDADPLSHEVDTWNTNGVSYVWVKVPEIPVGGATITMYWLLGDGMAAPSVDATAVWSSDYVGVWHMNETNKVSDVDQGVVTVKDSSGHQDGTGHGSSLVADGAFGKARGRNVVGDKGPAVTVPVYAELDALTTGSFTVSGWVKPSVTKVDWAYLFARKTQDSYNGWAASFSGNQLSNIRFFLSSSYYTFDPNIASYFSTDSWTRYDFVIHRGSSVELYLNGVLIQTKSTTILPVSGSEPFTIGGMNHQSTASGLPSGTTSTFNGYSDEVRLRKGAMSADWIKADYAMATDDSTLVYSPIVHDGIMDNWWVVEPRMDKTSWDVTETPGSITNSGELAHGTVSNVIYSVYDPTQTFESVADITEAGLYRAYFLPTEPERYVSTDYTIEIHVFKSQPYGDIVGNGGDSGRVLLMNNHTAKSGVINVDYQGWFDADNPGGDFASSSSTPTYWHHENLTVPVGDGNTIWNLKKGTESKLYTVDGRRLWHLVNCRHGNTFPTSSSSANLSPIQNYLPWNSTNSRSIIDHTINKRTELQTTATRPTVGQLVMQNLGDEDPYEAEEKCAVVYSSCFTNGIGTIYFDAVNGWCRDTENFENYKIVVEIATSTTEGKDPTDDNSLYESVEYDPDADATVVTTNLYGKLEGKWTAVPFRPFLHSAEGFSPVIPKSDTNPEGTTNVFALAVRQSDTDKMTAFYRIVVPLDITDPVRFRIRRVSRVPASSFDIDEGGFILLDNIIASVPADSADLFSAGHYEAEKTGSQILGWELSTSEPYPSVSDAAVKGSAVPIYHVNSGDPSTTDTSGYFASATMHYRWRYLNQTTNQPVSAWKKVDLNPNNGFRAVSPFDLPAGRVGDVEYWFEYKLQAPYYSYVDYSSAGVIKTSDYTEERGVRTNRLSDVAVPTGGSDWFFRLREGTSNYSGVDIVFRRGENAAPQREHMVLVGDHLWRGFVQTKENQAGTIYWRLEALDEQTAEFAEYAAKTNYWYNEPALGKLPISGSLSDSGTAESWTELELDAASGYVMFQIDDSVSPKSLTVVHADYQNANGWTDALNRKIAGHSEPIFVGTSTTNEYKIGVSPSKQTFREDFSDWRTMATTNVDWAFPNGFPDINNLYGRTAYESFKVDQNGLWDVGPGMWIAQQYRDDRDNAGVALQMAGYGNGYFQFTDKDLAPRGLESISFNARLTQDIQFDDVAYYFGGSEGILGLSNYTFVARTAFDLKANNNFKGNASLSVFANYLPNKGAYEARWEWLGNNSNAKRGQRLCLYRWNVVKGLKVPELIIAKTNTVFDVEEVSELVNSKSQRFAPLFISVSNDVPNKCTWVAAGIRRCGVQLGTSPIGPDAVGTTKDDGRNANWLGVCFKDTNSTYRLTRGTYGVLSANCPGVFALPEFAHKVQIVAPGAGKGDRDIFENSSLNTVSNLTDAVNCAERDLRDSDYFGWNIIPERNVVEWTSATPTSYGAVVGAAPAQDLLIYLGTAGRSDWGQEPYKTIVIDGFGGSPTNIMLYTTEDCSMRFAVGDGISDIAVDSVVLKQWRGGNWDDDDVYKLLPAWADDQHARSKTASVRRPGYTNFVFTSAWVTNNTVLLSAKRANLDVPSSIRAPLMDGYRRTAEGEDGTTRAKGLGMISFAYENAQPNAQLELQIATNNVDWSNIDNYDKSYSSTYWSPVTNITFAGMKPSGVFNRYLGIHDVKGAMRIIVSTNAINAVADETDASRFGDVTITALACSDEPAVDVHSWWGWNMRTIGGDDDGEKRMMLDDFSVAVGGAGLSVALNNSVSEDFDESLIDTDDRESYRPHKPFVQTPTFTTNFIGEVSFKARKYSPDDPTAAVVAFGSKNISTTDDGTWEPIDGAEFYITNSWYEMYSFKTPSETYRAVRLAVTGVENITETSAGGDNGLPPGIDAPQRVLLDEICVCEAVLPRMGFKHVGCFRGDPAVGSSLSSTTEISDVPRRELQPLCNESWGVQCEVYPAQLASDIDFKTYVPRVRLHWFTGTDPWGFDRWKGYSKAQGHMAEWLSRATDTDDDRYVYRSSMRTSPDAVVPMSTVAPTVVQYMLEVVYYTVGGAISTNWLSAADWQTPSWYSPLDFNADPVYGKGQSFAAYNILDNVAPGWAWINEVNIFGHFDRMKNTEEGKQFIEIVHPVEADITGWTVRLLEPKKGSDMVITNVLARFGSSGLKGTKSPLTTEDAYCQKVFRVLANEAAAKLPEFSIEDGTLDAVWKVDNPTTFFTKYGVIGAYDPVGFQLVRTSGIVEHEILVEGTNFIETLVGPPTYLQDTRDFLEAKMPGADFVLPGYDWGGDGNSLSVTQNFGRCGMEDPTNDWSSYVAMTPGRLNKGQYIDPFHPMPQGEEILVYLSVSGDHIVQSLNGADDTFTNGLLSVIVSKNSTTGTNVFYRTDPWYVLAEAKTGTVSMIDKAERVKATQPYIYRLNDVAKGISRGVTVVASAGLDPRIGDDFGVTEDNPYRDAIIDWFEKGTDVYGNPWYDVESGEIVLAKFRALSGLVVTNLTLTEMYWLDMDPTVTNSLIGGMASKPGGGPVVDEHVVTWSAVGSTLVLTNRRVKVYMMISNENGSVTAPARPRGDHDYGRYWTPYVLRGLAPGSNSLGYGVTTGRWDSATFKITGMLMTNYASFDDMSAKVPLRHFVFGADSFGEDGFSKIEVIDPYSPMSWGYNSGWRYWWEKQAAEGQKLDQVMYFWTLDTRLPQLEVEMLKEDSQYGD